MRSTRWRNPCSVHWGACDKTYKTYTGKKFTEEEFNEFLSIDIDDEDKQKEILRRKGIRLGK